MVKYCTSSAVRNGAMNEECREGNVVQFLSSSAHIERLPKHDPCVAYPLRM